MQTKEQVTEEFTRKLKSLLAEYDDPNDPGAWKASIEARDHWQGYAECGQDIRITVTIPAIWDKDGNSIREWTEIDLGTGI